MGNDVPMTISTLNDVVQLWGPVVDRFSDLTELYKTHPQLAQGWPPNCQGRPAFGTDLYNQTQHPNNTRFLVTFAHAAQDGPHVGNPHHNVQGRVVAWNSATGELTTHGDTCTYDAARAPLQQSKSAAAGNTAVATTSSTQPTRPKEGADLEPAPTTGYSWGGGITAVVFGVVAFFIGADLVHRRHSWGVDSEPLIEALVLTPMVVNILAWLLSKGDEEVSKIFRRDVLPTVATFLVVLGIVWPGVQGGNDDVKKAVASVVFGILFSALNLQSFKVLFEAITVAWRRSGPKL